jgi:hypothetical protein
MKLVLDYLDEIKLRLVRYQVAVTDDIMVLTYLNRARRQVFNITKDLYPERYGDLIEIPIDKTAIQLQSGIKLNFASIPIVVYETGLPNNYVDESVVLVSWNRGTNEEEDWVQRQARSTTKEELFGSTRSAYTTPTIWNPIYCWERNLGNLTYGIEPNTSFYKLLITGFDYNGVCFLDEHPETKIILYYIYGLDELALGDTDTVIPDIYYEFVIYYAMLYLMQNIQNDNVKDSINIEIQNMLGLIKQNYDVAEVRLNLKDNL